MHAINAAAAASHRAAQFAALVPALRQGERAAARPASRHPVRPSYAQQLRARIQSCTRQMSSVQAEQQKASFLSGVDVQEISLETWNQANSEYVPVWFI
jgi:hypothetical protein